MSNSYFKFKQFTVWQDQCAMKVGTLACILGAYAHHDNPKRILDIGAGTGLLSLMLAQKYPEANVDAVELEANAFRQATVNFEKSSWRQRLQLIHANVLDMKETEYDLIVSNPPFFEGHLKSPDVKVNLARHNDQLPFEKLIQKVSRMLGESAKFFVLLPPSEMKKLKNLALQNGLVFTGNLDILNLPGQEPKAQVVAFGKRKTDVKKEQLIIRTADNNYTQQFTDLLRAFYLHF